jgi:hypothetical protein
MKKMVGYAVSVLGLGLMAIGFEMVKVDLKKLGVSNQTYIAWAGIALVVIGVGFSLSNKSGKRKIDSSGKNEVPIYEGTGKKRKIVGYRKD